MLSAQLVRLVLKASAPIHARFYNVDQTQFVKPLDIELCVCVPKDSNAMHEQVDVAKQNVKGIQIVQKIGDATTTVFASIHVNRLVCAEGMLNVAQETTDRNAHVQLDLLAIHP